MPPGELRQCADAAAFDRRLYKYQPACDQSPVIIQIGGASQSADPLSYDGDGYVLDYFVITRESGTNN